MFKSRGKLRYGKTRFWVVVDCDIGFCDYYKKLYSQATHRTRQLMAPMWGAHITVVRNEVPPKLVRWNAHEGEIIEFTWYPGVDNNGVHYWLDVECERLYEIRVELGLGKEPIYPFHMTIGNRKHGI